MLKKFWKKLFIPNGNKKKLKEMFNLSSRDAKKADAEIRAYIAQIDIEENVVPTGISLILQEYVGNHAVDNLSNKCEDIAKLYIQNNKDWLWGENLFCIVAYLFTFVGLIIDIVDVFDFLADHWNETEIISIIQVITVLAVVWIGNQVVSKYRGNKNFEVWFTIANRSMPTFTMMAYVFYYFFKLMYVAKGMKLFVWIPVLYLLIGSYKIIATYFLYKHVSCKKTEKEKVYSPKGLHKQSSTSGKQFWRLMAIVTALSLVTTFMFGSEIPWDDLSKGYFSWPIAKTILYDISVGVFSSMILVWCIDRIQHKETEKREAKQRLILYNKLTPFLTEYYDFYLKLYIATRGTPVDSQSNVLKSLQYCNEEFIDQLHKTNPFYKDGCYSDSMKAQAQLALMKANANNPEALEEIMRMSTGLPWYTCWEIEGKKFYDGVLQIERDFPTFFPNELLEKVERLLKIVAPQMNLVNFVEGRQLLQWAPDVEHMPQLPTDFFVDAYEIKEIISVLNDIMAYIEQDSGKKLRYRELNFFNNRNTVPTIGHSCDEISVGLESSPS